ncbi:hypothetical protein D3C87_1734720 [compost metagenome]
MALEARADGHCNHVLLKTLVIADSGITTGREHVDEAFLDNDLQADIGVGFQEGCNDRWQYQPSSAKRHVQFEGSRGAVTEFVNDIQS